MNDVSEDSAVCGISCVSMERLILTSHFPNHSLNYKHSIHVITHSCQLITYPCQLITYPCQRHHISVSMSSHTGVNVITYRCQRHHIPVSTSILRTTVFFLPEVNEVDMAWWLGSQRCLIFGQIGEDSGLNRIDVTWRENECSGWSRRRNQASLTCVQV